jgi:hypothetical protein
MLNQNFSTFIGDNQPRENLPRLEPSLNQNFSTFIGDNQPRENLPLTNAFLSEKDTS